jgi:hypothetical protein
LLKASAADELACAGEFDVRLLVYSQETLLPAGSPGDPATDYTTAPGLFGALRGCGVRERDDDIPYAGNASEVAVVSNSGKRELQLLWPSVIQINQC